MAGNSKRRGAVRKPGSKKGAQVGTGGKGRRALEGRGPTPKAEDRPYHPAARKKKPATGQGSGPGAARGAAGRGGGAGRGSGAGRGGGAGRDAVSVSDELVAGRNPVVEAVRAGIPMADRKSVGEGTRVERG